MSVVKIIKWIVFIVILVLSVKYLGSLWMMLVASYILFSMLLPFKNKIQQTIKLKNDTFLSILTLLLPTLFLTIIVLYVFPAIITQLNSLTYLSYEEVFDNILHQFSFIETMIEHWGGKQYVLKSIQDTMYQVINIDILAKWSGVLLDNFTNILIHLLIIFFITFHLLKNENLLNSAIIFLIPETYHKDVEEILEQMKKILGKYFRGLLIDVSIIMTVNTLILTILGVKNSVLIGILSGLMNIIPYVGPLITLLIGLFLAVSGNIIEGHYALIGGTVLKIIITLVSVNVLDGVILQPYIFSNILRAHPLEIFLVIVGAGMLGGIVWMMLAIPIYVIFKIILVEILKHWKNWN